MWNYSFTLPGLMILTIIVVSYFARPRLQILKNRIFLFLILSDILVILFDVVSSNADTNYQNHSAATLYFLNLAFFVLYLLRIFYFYLFTVNVLVVKIRSWSRRVLVSIVFIVSELITLSSPFTGAVFSIGADGYHKGPLYNILYVCALFYLALSFIMLFYNRKNVSTFEFNSILAYNLILLFGNLIRYMYPKVIIMNTFCLMAILIIYLSFENPDLYGSGRGKSFNTRAFRERLDECMINGSFRTLCLLLRNYNEEREIYGYRQMDQGISLISDFIHDRFPAYDLFYLREGRFAILGDGDMDWDRMQYEILQRFKDPWNATNAGLFLNVDFIRFSDRIEYQDVDDILGRLLGAFNESAKNIGPDGQLVDLDVVHEVDKMIDVKRALENAIENNSIEIYLQPLVDSSTNEVVAAEVLARIRSEEGRIISPSVFIPIAEQNGQINRLGEQVFEKACRFISEGKLEQTGLQWLNVNLSPIQCMNKDLAEQFAAILRRNKVRADKIHLEVTEASIIDFSLIQKQIMSLRSNGFEFALDDYGSGYSNLTRVKMYPFINIKVDMEVVWNYFRDRDVLLPAIIGAFKQLDLSVTAEGIETDEMASVMRSIGCDYLQGFYFSMPIPVEEFMKKYSR